MTDAAPSRLRAPSASTTAIRGLSLVDLVRFAAAMHIVLRHTVHAQWLPAWMRAVIHGGAAGVFFLISGFILALRHTGDASPASRRTFWRARAARLYPLHLLTSTVVVALQAGRVPGLRLTIDTLLSLSLLQAWFPGHSDALNTPAWSLSVFAFLYLIFPWIAARLRGVTRGQALALIGALWLAELLPPTLYAIARPTDRIWFAIVHTFPLLSGAPFVVGVLLARLFAERALPRRTGLAVAAAALAGMFAAWILVPKAAEVPLRHGLLTPLFALLVFGAASADVQGWPERLADVCRQLGRLSLPLYLLHLPAYSAWYLLDPPTDTDGRATKLAAFALYLGATLALSYVVERWFVAPLARRLRTPRRAAASPLPAIAPSEAVAL